MRPSLLKAGGYMKPNYNNVSLKISAVKKSQFLKDRPQIIFCGRSNVGKSSMINCLLGRKSLARTSAKPGKTATINFYDIDGKLYFVDLPGYGYAKVSYMEKRKWSIFMEDYFKSDCDKRLAISVVDLRHGATHIILHTASRYRFPFYYMKEEESLR